jgi:uncharacterized membrane protein
MAKKKKFDTNPLDPEFPNRVTQPQPVETAPQYDAKTQNFPPYSVTEEPTRRYENPNFVPPYAPPFNGQNVPQAYQAARFAEMNTSGSRKVDKIGLPENIMTALPYLPSPVGLIAGVLELFLVPSSEAKVRFHAAQGLAAHIAILVISAMLGFVDNFMPFARLGGKIFWLATTICLIIWAIKAFRGKPVHIESVDDLTEWLEEKIQPRK